MRHIGTTSIGRNGRDITLCLSSLLIFVVADLSRSAGPYEISWYTIDGGGGTSSGGPYVLTGTIGQADTDWATGGIYELLGGFWPGGPLCIVEFDDFASFAEGWLNSASGLAADIDGDGDVDFDDLSWLADYWLCYCPVPWPMK